MRLPEDLPRGRRAAAKGCELGNLVACREGVSYAYDAAPAATCAAWESLCGRGDRISCTFFAACLAYTDDFRRDKPTARRMFQEGCARGERIACRELAFVSLNGDGVPRDLVRGFQLVDQACRMDDPLACAHAGRQLERGQGAPRDLERAKRLYRMACARGIRPIPCDGLRRLGEKLPNTIASHRDTSESNHVSERYDYEWRIPGNWEFVAPTSVAFTDAPGDADVAVARVRGGTSPEILTFVVTPYESAPTGRYRAGEPGVLDGFEDQATKWLAQHGAPRPVATRLTYIGWEAVRVDTRLQDAVRRYLTVILFRKDQRRFELRCLSDHHEPHTPCVEAFGALMIHDPPGDPEAFPHVIHVREPRFRLSYDAPDDSWLASAPRKGWDGRESAWMWTDPFRQIYLYVFDSTGMLQFGLDTIVQGLADSYRGDGVAVRRKESTMAGEPCAHLEIDEGADKRVDTFVLRRNGITYQISVTASMYDPDLLERAKAGLRIDREP